MNNTARILPFRGRTDRDPMEAPGATYCAHCGAYPIAGGEVHECEERDH